MPAATRTADEAVQHALTAAGGAGLTMAAAVAQLADHDPAAVRERIRSLWDADRVTRMPDGRFVLRGTRRTGNATRAAISDRAMDQAARRVAAAQGRGASPVKVTRVDPALLRAFCPACREQVIPDKDGSCRTCGTQTGANRDSTRPRKRSRARKPLRAGQKGYGPTCTCGAPKTKQARACAACEKQARPGRKIGPHRNAKPPTSITEPVILEARALYASGLSMPQVAARVWPRTTYKSLTTCTSSLYSIFNTRGWKLRDQAAVTAARNFKHGRKKRGLNAAAERAYRRQLAKERGWDTLHGPGQPLCSHIAEKTGKPCGRKASSGTAYCYAHDPGTAEARKAHANATRHTKRYREPVLDIEPFAVMLNRLYMRHGSWTKVAHIVQQDSGAVSRWAHRKTRTVTVRVVTSVATAAGVPVHELYPDVGRPAESVAS